jgi:hypothetical protein
MATIHESEETIPFTRPVMITRLIVAKVKWWGWNLLFKVLFGFVAVGIAAEGARLTVPGVAQKVYRLPFLGFLKHYEAFYRLDLAPILALIVMVLVFMSVGAMVKFWIELTPSYKPGMKDQLIFLCGSVLVLGDSYLFYRGIATMS